MQRAVPGVVVGDCHGLVQAGLGVDICEGVGELLQIVLQRDRQHGQKIVIC